MALSVAAFSDLPEELLVEFLQRMGMPREVAEWRYLDARFNRGRNRGFAWIPHDRIEGMIGLIPFRLSGSAGECDVSWSCDWMLANPSKNPGMGIVLLNRAIQDCGRLFALGGNANTQRLLPRIAVRTMPDAAVGLRLRLRASAYHRRVEQSGLARRLLRPSVLAAIPLRWIGRSGRQRTVRSEPGLAPSIASLIEAQRGDIRWPGYDFEYVDWQIGRAPMLVSETSYSPTDAEPRAAAVYWTAPGAHGSWRLALWARAGAAEHLAMVLREATSRVYERGGAEISTIVSRVHVDRLAHLRATGFTVEGSRTLYECASADSGDAGGELSGLSYLDTDLAYRF
jgi:hypothetical protein